MQITTTSILLLIPSIFALPHWPPILHHRSTTTTSTPTSTPTLPTSTLPSPPSGLTLKYIALGLGTQNYSCPSSSSSTSISSTSTSSSPSTTPLSIGALATLYDATHLFTTTTTLGPSALSILTNGITCLADSLDSSLSLPQLGHHYFDALGRPTFDLSSASAGAFLSAKKVANVAAPGTACAGRNQAEAVDWLMLVDNGCGLSREVSAVYRVETVGGKAVDGGCGAGSVGGTVVSDYAALYWLFG